MTSSSSITHNASVYATYNDFHSPTQTTGQSVYSSSSSMSAALASSSQAVAQLSQSQLTISSNSNKASSLTSITANASHSTCSSLSTATTSISSSLAFSSIASTSSSSSTTHEKIYSGAGCAQKAQAYNSFLQKATYEQLEKLSKRDPSFSMLLNNKVSFTFSNINSMIILGGTLKDKPHMALLRPLTLTATQIQIMDEEAKKSLNNEI